MNAIEVDQLSKVFTGKKLTKVNALKSVSFTVSQGEVFGFLGPNGAGKSTTIKCLMGLIRPSSGSATIMGEPIGSVSSRMKLGFLPENPAFYDYLTAEEYLHFAGKLYKMTQDLLFHRVEEMLKKMELWDARKRPIRGYSKGMVQRVGIAQALLHEPDVCIFDEPMSGLDPLGRALVKDIIIDLKKQGKCVFFSTHITDDVEKVCDRVAVINKGQLIVVDSVDSVLQRGIEGYAVSLTDSEGLKEELFVTVADLQIFIKQTVYNRQNIDKIEPRRKNMEAFFLEIVAQ